MHLKYPAICLISTIATVGLLQACAAQPGKGARATGQSSGGRVAIPPPPSLPPVNAARAVFYKGAIPGAAKFVAKGIPPNMVRSMNQGNDVYVVALDASGKKIGYLRDFEGPVTLGAECECAPLNVTLAFNAEGGFETLISPAPLTKRNHQAMTDADVARLIEIAKAPSAALQKERRVEGVVDAVSSATKTDFEGSVVSAAALTTKRVVDLVRDTRRVLKGAPLAWDRRRLSEILRNAGDNPAVIARSLAQFLPTAQSDDVAVESFHGMTKFYIDSLKQGGEPDAEVERRMINPGLPVEISATETIEACYRLTNANLRLRAADKCARSVRDSGAPVHPASLARLSGTLLYLEGKPEQAVSDLQQAADQFDVLVDPWLHLRLTAAKRAAGDAASACTSAKSVFAHHPLLPGAKKQLEACGTSARQVMEEVYASNKTQLLASRLGGGKPVPELPVEDERFNGSDLELGERGKVTVAMFFATWCPHCQAEMPRVVNFARVIQKQAKLSERVRVVGVRTSVEKEKESWESFKKRFTPNFPIWTDPIMSLAFSKFAKSQGLPAAIPALVVLDENAVVQYLLEAGDYRDTARELVWAVNDVLSDPPPPPTVSAEPIAPTSPAEETPTADAPLGDTREGS